MNRQQRENFYKTWYHYGITVAMFYLNSLEDAEQVYNDAMLTIFSKHPNEIIISKPWIRKIIVNKSIDLYRKKKYMHIIDINEYVQNISIENDILSNLDIHDVYGIISNLPISYRSVFMLHVVDGYKFTEIAEMLEITEGGAKALFHKAKIKLQNIINQNHKEYGFR
jgi:RNA polymerase sigma-70 factor (ECF subfamily)